MTGSYDRFYKAHVQFWVDMKTAFLSSQDASYVAFVCSQRRVENSFRAYATSAAQLLHRFVCGTTLSLSAETSLPHRVQIP